MMLNLVDDYGERLRSRADLEARYLLFAPSWFLDECQRYCRFYI